MEGYFPVLIQTGINSLGVIFRTGGTHLGTSATVAVAFSANGGISWSDPKEIAPRWQDARNPAFGVNAKGHIIAAYWKAKKCYNLDEMKKGRTVWLGDNAPDNTDSFYKISRDGGKNWDEEKPLILNPSGGMKLYCPYGRIISDNNGVLYMGVYGVKKGDNTLSSFLMRSGDGGETWGDFSVVSDKFNETAFVFKRDNPDSMVAALRSEDGAVYIAHSGDKGRKWSVPERVTRPGEHPGDLCELQSGKLLLTYGRRIRPMGCGAIVSCDGGKTWDHDREILLAGDGILNGDLGYPSTVQLDDGTLNTALYFSSGSEPSHLNWGDVNCQMIKYSESDIIK